jgi:TRAP-type C4-dicarboxylate transport system permease small subunit
MFLPDDYVWIEPVIVAAIIVFAVDLVGNSLAYGGRLVNALATAAVFLVIFAALAYFGLGKLELSTDAAELPSRFLPGDLLWLEPVLIATGLVFVVGLVGNMLSFKNRLMNALVTAVIFLVVFGAVTYFGYGSVEVDLPDLPSVETPTSE